MPALDLGEELARLPAQPLAALRLLRLLAEGSESSLSELTRVINMDPVLSVRVMRLANSPFRGRPMSVRSTARAVVLLGYDTVTAISAAAASRLIAGGIGAGPRDFWSHSMTVAAAASACADVLGVSPADAFSAGLQHDIGAPLLYRADPEAYERAAALRTIAARLMAEREAFSYDHPTAGARALEAWHFPRAFVQAIRTHHHPVDSVNPLAQAIMLGEAVAERVDPSEHPEDERTLEQLLDELGLPLSSRRDLVFRTQAELERIRTEIGQAE